MKMAPAMLPAVVFIVALLALLQSINSSRNSTENPPVVWEAESAERIEKPFNIRSETQASDGHFVQLYPNQRKSAIRYRIMIQTAGLYTLWARARWGNSCRNSIEVNVNGTHFSILGNDSLYNEWHWVKGNSYSLQEGVNNIIVGDPASLVNLDGSIQLDQFLLTTWEESAATAFIEANLKETTDVYFGDNFASNWRDQWTDVSGRWESRDPGNLMYIEQTKPAESILLMKTEVWNDYSFEVSVRPVGVGAQGIVFDYLNGRNYLIVQLLHKNDKIMLELIRVADGHRSIEAQESVAAQAADWARLQVEAFGDTIQISWNEEKKIHTLSRQPAGAILRLGLFSSGAAGAAFDDVEARSLDSASASRTAWLEKKYKRELMLRNYFAHPNEGRSWPIIEGNWSISNGFLQSPSGPSSIVHRRAFTGDTEFRVIVNLEIGNNFYLFVADQNVRHNFQIHRKNEVLSIRSFAHDQLVEQVTVGIPDNPSVPLRLVLKQASLALNLGEQTVATISITPFPEQFRFGFGSLTGMAQVDSVYILQTPHYSYVPWSAPVGWTATRGTLKIGHVFLYTQNVGGEGLIWHKSDFACRDTLYEATLLIRGDAPPGAYIELVLCNQGTESINGTVLRLELIDEPRLFSAEKERVAKITLFNGDKVIGESEGKLRTLPIGFVMPILGIENHEGLTQVYIDHSMAVSFVNPDPGHAGKAGVKFVTKGSSEKKALGLARFRVFSRGLHVL